MNCDTDGDMTATCIEEQKVRYDCAHESEKDFVINVYGQNIVPQKDSKFALCPQCLVRKLRKEVIRCCFCGSPILPNSGVALYTPSVSMEYLHKAHKTDDGKVVGCQNKKCISSGAFTAQWDGASFVPHNIQLPG